MNFFQNSVLNKHLKAQDSQAIKAAYSKFSAYFHNPVVQQNIREAKEEQFQEGFLRELFVAILGYTLNPSPNFNLTTEYKNVKDSKKADGAIIINGVVKAVIELKGTETTDLNRIETQAFGYKNNQPECVYVITSNFEKLRFYIDNAIENIEFNLFTLTEKEFELLWLCLAFVNIEKNLAKRIKDESVSQEDVITKSLYNDYSLFKRELHQNLVALNPDHDPLTLFKKSQKLLDRFLFLFFAEDRQLLPPNSVRLILDDWRDLQDKDVDISLYARFKKYFEYLNTGFKGKRYDVFAYNGGLFKTDELLDGLKIDDELLYRHTLKLSDYDFVSEVDVNILGHIFENSLNELDEIKAQLEGQQVDKTKSKRKKDGVFYTPKYITKYIVDNTVGKLCMEKKAELELIDEEYTTDRKRTIKTKQPLFEKLNTYRNWLLQLTICDPACGSGAFLNQALDFLINEHRYIDELQAKLFGDAMVLSDFEKNILENNLFGVDINEESVEIAKLSLWLRTAQPNRKLNDLNNNIKCGNSLIDDPAVAGDKAFNWQQEFPSVFAKGGFDVVIGNPPYVQSHSISEIEKKFIYANYKTAEYQINTYGIFVEKFLSLLKPNSIYSLIIPNYWLSTKYDQQLRKEVFVHNHACELVNTYQLFEDATVDTLLLTGRNIKSEKSFTNVLSISSNYKTINERLNAINLGIWGYSVLKEIKSNNDDITISFNTDFKLVGEKCLKDFLRFKKGMQPYEEGKGIPTQTREMMERKIYHSPNKLDESYLPLLGSRHIKRFYLQEFDEYIKYGKNLAAPRNPEIFIGERILINRILSRNNIDGVLLSEQFINNTDIFNLLPFPDNTITTKVLYALILSKLCAVFFKKANINLNRAAFPKINVNTLETFPLPHISDLKQRIIEAFVDSMHSNYTLMYKKKKEFIGLLKDNLGILKVNQKIDSFNDLTFGEFLIELAKLKISLSLPDQVRWKEFFELYKIEINQIQSEIDKTDNEIDRMVYELYVLTEEEIKIVEGTN